MNARIASLLASALLVSGAADASAGAPTVHVGDRVKVTASRSGGFRLAEGELLALDGGHLVLRDSKGRDQEFLASTVTTMKVHTGYRPRLPRFFAGAGIGLLTGAAFGAAIGYSDGGDGFFTPGDMAIIGATVFGTIGTVVGGLAGVASGGDRWETARKPSFDVGVLPRSGGGVTLVAARAF